MKALTKPFKTRCLIAGPIFLIGDEYRSASQSIQPQGVRNKLPNSSAAPSKAFGAQFKYVTIVVILNECPNQSLHVHTHTFTF